MKFLGPAIFSLLLIASTQAISQERPGLPAEGSYKVPAQDELNANGDLPAFQNKEKEQVRDTSTVKSSASSRSKSDVIATKKAEEETLSYNVLYFIIQKFKVSDMIN